MKYTAPGQNGRHPKLAANLRVRGYSDPQPVKPDAPPRGRRRVHHVLGLLDGVREEGDAWKALCPAHPDGNPSLAVSEGEGGKVLLHCFADCPTKDVLAVLGLQWSDLDPARPMTVARYPYHDEQGVLLYEVLRQEPKNFKQRRPDGKGGWLWSVKDVRRVPYRLPGLLAADPNDFVFVVEGEKDADRLTALGLVATCNAGGGGKWLAEYSGHFTGRRVVVLPDNDDPGRVHAAQVCGSLHGVAAEVRMLALPGLPDKGDVSDWLDAGGTKEELLELSDKAELHRPPAEGAAHLNHSDAAPHPTPRIGQNPLIQLISPTLGEAAYHGLPGQFLRAVAPHTEATDAGVLAHLLPAVGTLIGPGPHVFAGAKQPAKVNFVLVGPTNTGRKGTAFAPVDLLLRRTADRFWATQRCSGLATGEGLIAALADRWSRDEDGNEQVEAADKRLLVVEQEFSRVLAQARRDGNILSQVVREAFDGGDLAVMTRGMPLRADGTHVSIVGHITPEELSLKLSGVDQANGFGNRFLWFAVRSDKVIPHTTPIPPKLLDRFAPRLRAMSNLPSRAVPLTPEAKERWEAEMYPQLREDRPGLAGAMSARGSAFVLRVALIYALLDGDPKRAAVAPEHLRAAKAVWDYSVASAYQLFRTASGTPLGDKLLQLLASAPMKKSAFTDHVARPVAEIDTALKQLEQAGRVRKVVKKTAGPGRPAEVWELVPNGNK